MLVSILSSFKKAKYFLGKIQDGGHGHRRRAASSLDFYGWNHVIPGGFASGLGFTDRSILVWNLESQTVLFRDLETGSQEYVS